VRYAGWNKSYLRRAILIALLAAVPGCTAPTSYMGIVFNSDVVEPELRNLAALASSGDKHAQLELGIRFEEGRGVPIDRNRAITLYRLAAAGSGGPLWVWVPAMVDVPGRVLPITHGQRVQGLIEASKRLQAIQ
jgi:hypothetical protein